MYAIHNTRKKVLEDDGDGLTVYYTDKAKIDHMVSVANNHKRHYEVVEAKTLSAYSLINDFILIRPSQTIDESLEISLRDSPERAEELASIKEKILSMPIDPPETPGSKSSIVDYRVERVDGKNWGNTEFQASGLFYDPIEMMREVVDLYGQEIKRGMGNDENFYFGFEPFKVVIWDMQTENMTNYVRHYRLVELNDGDRIIYGNEKKGIPSDSYEIEAIETESGKIETSGSLVVLAGPGGRTYGVHAGDFIEAEMTFLQKPGKKRFQP